MDGVVAPVDQVFPEPAEDVNVTAPPAQNVVGPLAVIVGVDGVVVAVTIVAVEVAEHPPLVTVTVYEPEADTEMDGVVAPVDQEFPVAEEDVKVTDPGEQKVVGPPAVIVGVAGVGLTVTVVAADVRVQPEAFETVTV